MEPFGFGRKQVEKKMDNPDNFDYLQPISVNAVMKKDKTVRPLSILWEDEVYMIDKVFGVKEGRSLKDYQKGYVYRCRVGMKEFVLVFNGECWFIDL